MKCVCAHIDYNHNIRWTDEEGHHIKTGGACEVEGCHCKLLCENKAKPVEVKEWK